MKKILIFAPLAAMLLGACSSDINDVSSDQVSNKPISFRTVSEKGETKATLTTDAMFSNFTLNAMSTMNASGTVFDFMDYFAVVRKVGSAWHYAPEKFYPIDDTDYINFFAYSPSGSRNASMTPVLGSPTLASLHYKVPLKYGTLETDLQQEDLLVAATRKNTGAVDLAFTHALAAVSFQASNKTQGITFVIEGIQLLRFDSEGDLEYDANAKTYTWKNNQNYTDTYTVSFPSGIVLLPPTDKEIENNFALLKKVKLTSDNEKMMVLPQSLPSSSTGGGLEGLPINGKSYVKVTYSSIGGDYKYLSVPGSVRYIPLPANFAFSKNTKHLLHFDFIVDPQEEVTMGTMTTSTWGTATNDLTAP